MAVDCRELVETLLALTPSGEAAPTPMGWVSCHADRDARLPTLLTVSRHALNGIRSTTEVEEWLAKLPNVRRGAEEAWLAHLLDTEHFRILRMGRTEPANTGRYTAHADHGDYLCAGCSVPLFASEHKQNDECGWPSFNASHPNSLKRGPGRLLAGKLDDKKVEINCAVCSGHLGHAFKHSTHRGPGRERHCVNSAAIRFRAASQPQDGGHGDTQSQMRDHAVDAALLGDDLSA
jgi:peptide-methionine (R)-S-oxide reductase